MKEADSKNLVKSNEIQIEKVKDIDLISSFNDSGFLNDEDEDENNKNFNVNNNIEKKENELDFMTKIKENNILVRENEELKNKLTIISSNSQKLLKIFENPRR